MYMGPSVLSLPTSGHWVREEVPVITVSSSLLPFFMWPLNHLLCRSCSVSHQFFFRRNCYIWRCRFGVSVGEDKFRDFLTTLLNHLSHILVHFKDEERGLYGLNKSSHVIRLGSGTARIWPKVFQIQAHVLSLLQCIHQVNCHECMRFAFLNLKAILYESPFQVISKWKWL